MAWCGAWTRSAPSSSCCWRATTQSSRLSTAPWTGAFLFLGDNDGNFEMIDTREKADKSNSVNLHDKKLNTLHVSRFAQSV